MLTWKAFSHHLWIIIILMTLLKECPHFLSRLLHTSFLKPWNDELAFHVRVVPQIKCRVTGFISLLKHLVLFSALQERGRKHVKALTVLSTDVFLFLQLYYETYCLQREKKLSLWPLHLSRLIFTSVGLKAVWPAFPDSSLGPLPGARKVGVQVMGVCGDVVYLQQCHIKCHDVNNGDVNHHYLPNFLATKQYFPPQGSYSSLMGTSVAAGT